MTTNTYNEKPQNDSIVNTHKCDTVNEIHTHQLTNQRTYSFTWFSFSLLLLLLLILLAALKPNVIVYHTHVPTN